MLYSVISQKYNTHKSYLNYKNQFGLCKSILEMPENTEVLIIEAGMRALGDVELISKYAQPDIAVLTNISQDHLDYFKDYQKYEDTKLGYFVAENVANLRITDGDNFLQYKEKTEHDSRK